MSTDVKELMRRIENVDVDALSDVLVGYVFDPCDGFTGYEAAKSLQSVVRKCETAHEFDIVNDTCIAILGWSLNTLVTDAEAEERKQIC